MSTEALGVGAAAPVHDQVTGAASVADAPKHSSEAKKNAESSFLHSPPDSNNAAKSDTSDSELSDLDEEPILDDATPFAKAQEAIPGNKTVRIAEETTEDQDAPPESQPEPQPEEDDIGEVLPDSWSGKVAIFKPTMHQFKDFKKFMAKVNPYGMKSGIVKIIPPEEWKAQQPPLDDMIKTLRVREPIKQDIMGSNGTYRQVNILHGRSYNVPQWRQLCDQSEHQPPARRGERRANAVKPKPRPAASKSADTESSTPKARGRAKPKKGRGGRRSTRNESERPMTPVSPKPEVDAKEDVVESVESVEKELGEEVDPDDTSATPGRMGAVKGNKSKTQSVSARRKYQRREGSAVIDEAAFKDFDYKMDLTDYTPERCEELERAYWKTLTYAAPLYGADMMGTLFDERTENWNLNKLPNLLDVLGTKIPGVNTAYLYFGMWKATFAWHLEDVDLYSINYVHFGAPKQWYSISQADARRFEGAMKNIWPADAKACSQFLRHKGFLISPQHLASNYNIEVNKVVSYPGEFVVTFPYGYHSGYNLGYNCAEAVNFALEPWLEMGKIAKRCECAQAQDSVWINVYEIERKLRGEPTPEYDETDEDDDEDEDDEDDESGLLSPPNAHGVKIKMPGKKRKRAPGDPGKTRVKRIKLRLKSKAEPPCCLCPNDNASLELLPTEDGRKVHRLCALYLPETYIDADDDGEVVFNVNRIHKDRAELKCLYCKSKRGACFQCSQGKCTRSYHATCAAAAGVFVEEEEVPILGEDKVEYKEQAFEFSCRFHRSKRDKNLQGDALEKDKRILSAAEALKKGSICQLQYFRADVFAGIVVENRPAEQTLLVDILPSGDRLEVEWKWLLVADSADYHLPKASPNAIPMPTSRSAKDKINGKRPGEDLPRKDDPFTAGCTWAEFNHHELERNREQVKVDFAKPDQLWHYIGGKGSTETKAQFTEDPRKRRVNSKANFLDTVPKAPKPFKTGIKKASASRPSYLQQVPPAITNQSSTTSFQRFEKPYVYKPRQPAPPSNPSTFTVQQFAATPQMQQQQQQPPPPHYHNNYAPNNASNQSYYQHEPQDLTYPRQVFELKPPQPQYPSMQYTRPVGTPTQNRDGFWSYPPQPHQQGYGQSPASQPWYGQQPSARRGYGQSPSHQQQGYGQPPPQQSGYASSPQPQQQAYTPHPGLKKGVYPSKPSVQPQKSAQSPQTQQQHPAQGPLAQQQSYTQHPQSHQSYTQSPQPQHDGRSHAPQPQAFSQGLRPPTKQAHCYSHTPAQGHANSQALPAPAKSAAPAASAQSSVKAKNPTTGAPVAASKHTSSMPNKSFGASIDQPPKSSNLKFKWTVSPKVYQQYPFFQVNHNRDSSKYRTPYSLTGGFVNGYEGDLKAHLTANPDQLTKKLSDAVPPRPENLKPVRPGSAFAQANEQLRVAAEASAVAALVPLGEEPIPVVPDLVPSTRQPAPKTQAKPTGRKTKAQTKAQPQPKKNAELAPAPTAVSQQPTAPASQAKKGGKKGSELVYKAYEGPKTQAPVKESPVPLPAKFLAAMGPPAPRSPASSSPTATPPPMNGKPNAASSRKSSRNSSSALSPTGPAAPTQETTPTTSAHVSSTTATSANVSSTNGKISTTPVPIPRLPGMTPHQAAAQAMRQTPVGTNGLVEFQTSSPDFPTAQAGPGPEAIMADAPPQAQPDPLRIQEFPDVPGSESMQFMDNMMANLRRVSSH